MKFETKIDIAAPPDRVWPVMSDIDRWNEWTPSITSVKRLSSAPFAVGTRVLVRQPKLPPAFWKITSIDPGKSFTWISDNPGLRVTARHSVEPVAGGSRVTLSLDTAGVFGGVFGRITKAITERYMSYEASGLKARTESQ